MMNEPERRSGLQPDLNSSDPYAVLGLARGASLAEVKKAYFALVREYPPEQQPEAFKLIRRAYERLRTADVKIATDLFLFRPPTPYQPRKRLGKLNLDFDVADIFYHLQQYGDLGRTEFPEDFRPMKL
jgi:curved DNA-binding protein CbpA